MSQAVVVVAAHAFEARAAVTIGRQVTREPWGRWMLYRGEMWDIPLAVIRCGPGKVAAAAAAQAAVQYLNPAVLVSFGTAGCPDRSVEIGTLTVAVEVVDVALSVLEELPVRIPDRFEPTPELRSLLLEVPGTLAASLYCWEGHVASPLVRPPARPAPRTQLAVVDWESAAVAQVAEMWEIPWAAVKVVSDHGEAERLRLLALVARRPLQWGAEVVRRACNTFVDVPAGAGTTSSEESPEACEAGPEGEEAGG